MSTESLQAAKLFSVDGIVAVVTGGGSGLGAYMARTLALNGAKKVYIIGRRLSSLQTVASSLPSHPNTIIPLEGDVTSKPSLQSCLEQITQSGTTHIDVLIANSGISGPPVPTLTPDQQPLPFTELVENMLSPSPEDVASTYLVNVVGVQFTIATFLPLLAAANEKRSTPPTAENFRARPQIITTGSIGGFNRRPYGNLSYGPSKAAVMHLTKQLATMLVPYDIRVNGIAPGMYFSEMTQGMYQKTNTTEKHNVEGTFPKEYVPATRTGDEEDMAGAILYLCSRAGAYVNGNILVTDGGRLSVMPATY